MVENELEAADSLGNLLPGANVVGAGGMFIFPEIINNLYPKVEDNTVADAAYTSCEYDIVVKARNGLYDVFLEMKAAFGKFGI
jgi:hypothetical protein